MDVYKPISRKEMLAALVRKFGGVETARYFLNDAIDDLRRMETGIGENNPMLAAKYFESLRTSISNIQVLLETKEYKPGIEGEIKGSIDN